MYTETYGQLCDRIAVAELKEFHFKQAGNDQAAEAAHQLVEFLVMACEHYEKECYAGVVVPRVQKSLRFHNHNDVEAWRKGKKATPDCPDSIGKCIAELARVHADYWEAQSSIQTLKALIDKTTVESERRDFEHEMVVLQRTRIDLDNQYRNELVEHIDALFLKRVAEVRERRTQRGAA